MRFSVLDSDSIGEPLENEMIGEQNRYEGTDNARKIWTPSKKGKGKEHVEMINKETTSYEIIYAKSNENIASSSHGGRVGRVGLSRRGGCGPRVAAMSNYRVLVKGNLKETDTSKVIVPYPISKDLDFIGLVSLDRNESKNFEDPNHLQSWKHKVFWDLNRKKRRLWTRLAGIQHTISYNKSNSLLKLEKDLMNELDALFFKEEVLWFQKSRCDWIASGDRNTKYYYMATVVQSNRKKILGLFDGDGEWILDEDELQ